MAQSPTRELPEPEIVISVHERVPTSSLIRAREPHLDLTDHHP